MVLYIKLGFLKVKELFFKGNSCYAQNGEKGHLGPKINIFELFSKFVCQMILYLIKDIKNR